MEGIIRKIIVWTLYVILMEQYRIFSISAAYWISYFQWSSQKQCINFLENQTVFVLENVQVQMYLQQDGILRNFHLIMCRNNSIFSCGSGTASTSKIPRHKFASFVFVKAWWYMISHGIENTRFCGMLESLWIM